MRAMPALPEASRLLRLVLSVLRAPGVQQALRRASPAMPESTAREAVQPTNAMVLVLLAIGADRYVFALRIHFVVHPNFSLFPPLSLSLRGVGGGEFMVVLV